MTKAENLAIAKERKTSQELVMDQYDMFKSWALRHYDGPLREAVAAEHQLARTVLERRILSSAYWSYEGPDTAPFALYVRWMKPRVTIAAIEGKGQQCGRLPLICRAFEATGLEVRWEAVTNPYLRGALRRRGYLQTPSEPTFSADFLHTP